MNLVQHTLGYEKLVLNVDVVLGLLNELNIGFID